MRRGRVAGAAKARAVHTRKALPSEATCSSSESLPFCRPRSHGVLLTCVTTAMRRRRVGLAVGVIALVAPAMGAAGESAEVTIRVDSYFDRGSMSRKVRLSGNVASRAAGEVVEVLAKPCVVKNSFYRLVAAARTVSGGSWFLTNDDQVPRSGFFRARWRGKDSTPLLVRPPATSARFGISHGGAWRLCSSARTQPVTACAGASWCFSVTTVRIG
jgi:hypothetical protein